MNPRFLIGVISGFLCPVLYSTVFVTCHFSTNCVHVVSLHKSWLYQYLHDFREYLIKFVLEIQKLLRKNRLNQSTNIRQNTVYVIHNKNVTRRENSSAHVHIKILNAMRNTLSKIVHVYCQLFHNKERMINIYGIISIVLIVSILETPSMTIQIGKKYSWKYHFIHECKL